MATLLSILQGLFLESPGPLAIAMVLAAVVLTVSGVNRRHKGLLLASALLISGAVGLFVLSTLVVTQREEVSAATRQLLSATQHPVNMAGIRDKLAPEVRVLGPDGDVWLDVDKLYPEIESALTRWPVQRHTVRESFTRITHVDSRDLARTELQLSTRSTLTDKLDMGQGTRWIFRWERNSQGRWKVYEIQWLQWMGHPPSKGMWQ